MAFRARFLALAVTILFVSGNTLSADEAKQAESKPAARVVKIGAVGGNNPKGRAAFSLLTAYLNQNGYPSEFVLFRSYDDMNEALKVGKINIAWNSPMGHAKFHLDSECQSQTLAMREGDRGLHVMLVAGKESGIKSLGDLAGKRVIVGRQHYQEGMLSIHLLKEAGVDLQKTKLVRLPAKGKDGRRTDTGAHILAALADGCGDAAVVPLGYWRQAQDWRKENKSVDAVWKSPEFNHCVFSACADFDPKLGSRFANLMTKMNLNDPLGSKFNRLEGTRRWLEGDSKGFESLVAALREHRAKQPEEAKAGPKANSKPKQ